MTSTVHIVISGPVQCGKSIVMARIEQLLRSEFDATVVSDDLERERRIGRPDHPQGHEIDMVSDTVWHLSEVTSRTRSANTGRKMTSPMVKHIDRMEVMKAAGQSCGEIAQMLKDRGIHVSRQRVYGFMKAIEKRAEGDGK